MKWMGSSDLQPSILGQTSDWIVVSKPSGWLTIAGRGQPETPVLLDWVIQKVSRHGPQATDQRPMTVHRIDRETSGVVLFALHPDAHRLANSWFEKRQITKTYHCLAHGKSKRPVCKIETPIESQSALTQVEVLEQRGPGFLAAVRIVTGRRHQIRIHLSSVGHPLWGDVRYGGQREIGNVQVGRVALHASRLVLPSGLEFEAPWPDDFKGWVEALRAQPSGTQTA